NQFRPQFAARLVGGRLLVLDVGPLAVTCHTLLRRKIPSSSAALGDARQSGDFSIRRLPLS
ncbi:MAG: hypothetical protein KDI88_18360, partial [Gammaproteobacteria bacterium]|nr:hypothetical protein [Gammaproteobacteria bacterium]